LFVVMDAFATKLRMERSTGARCPRQIFGVNSRSEYEPPQGEMEEALARSWEELLGIERVRKERQLLSSSAATRLLIVQMLENLRTIGLVADRGAPCSTMLRLLPSEAVLCGRDGRTSGGAAETQSHQIAKLSCQRCYPLVQLESKQIAWIVEHCCRVECRTYKTFTPLATIARGNLVPSFAQGGARAICT